MSLTFIAPQGNTQPLHHVKPSLKSHKTVGLLEMSASVPGVGGSAVATLAIAVARRYSRGSQNRRNCIGMQAFENELGVQAPVGFWDPLGLAKDGDVESFKRRRATELKHGRVAMLACIGYITPEFFRFPGDCSPSK